MWAVLGGIAEATDHLRNGTGVTAPLIRMHPAIVAQAAATAAVMLDGRFFLGVGTGERLNENITGAHWPRPDVRRDMLEEAVGIIRQLWDGGPVDHHGAHYTVEQAQLFTLPDRRFIATYAAAGFNQILIHQIGPDQEGFLRFYETQVLPAVQATP